MLELTIKPLHTAPEHIDRVVDWHYAQWNSLHPGESRADAKTRILAEETGDGSSVLPMLFVGIDPESGEPVGTAGLIENDLSSRTDLRPWVASVYTDAFRRGQGIGSAMMRHVEEYAYANGFDHIYLYTPDAVPFYEGVGWHVYDRGSTGSGHTVTIMRKDFAPKRSTGERSLRDKVEAKRRQDAAQAERELAAVAGNRKPGNIHLTEDPFAADAAGASGRSKASASRSVSSSPSSGSANFGGESRIKQLLAGFLVLMLIPASLLLFNNCKAMRPQDLGPVDFGGPGDKTSIATESSAGGARPNAVFADANLEAVVRRQLSMNTEEAIAPGLLASIESLDASGQGIESLAGIGLLSNLRSILLKDNEIGTLRPLFQLANLTEADLRDNPFHCASQRRNAEKIRAAGVELLTDCEE